MQYNMTFKIYKCIISTKQQKTKHAVNVLFFFLSPTVTIYSTRCVPPDGMVCSVIIISNLVVDVFMCFTHTYSIYIEAEGARLKPYTIQYVHRLCEKMHFFRHKHYNYQNLKEQSTFKTFKE